MIISVIVPFYNEEKYLDRCARSLLNQQFDKKDYELIFVDNASTDKSAEIVRRFPEIILLRENKRGSYAARNLGLKYAKGKVVAFTDGDCEADSGWLRAIHNSFLSTGAGILWGRVFPAAQNDYRLQLMMLQRTELLRHLIDHDLKQYYWAYTNNMAFRKTLFEGCGLFSEWQRGADTEFVQRCLRKDPELKVAYVPEMSIIHSEIRKAVDWYKKMYLYGFNNAYLQGSSYYFCDIPLAYKFKTYLQLMRDQGYGLSKQAVVIMTLFAGYLFNLAGKIKGHLSFFKSPLKKS